MADRELRDASKVETIEGRTPTPKVRGNLPAVKGGDDDSKGRVVPARPIEFYERASPAFDGPGNFISRDWGPYPEPPPGFPMKPGLTESDIAELRRREPTAGYNQGGRVSKFGSSTSVSCKHK